MEQETEIRGIIRAVCISSEKGTEKRPVPEAILKKDFGIEGDAHAGKWHRQVSLLSYDKVEAFNALGAQVQDGDFGENILVEGIDLKSLPVGSILRAGTVVMRMTQIGKECHTSCAIRMRVGDCIMPREGVFAEVLEEGMIRPGDVLTAQLPDPERPFTAAVITLSDKGAKGDRVDQSGPAAVQMLEQAGYEVIETLILPDEPALLKQALIRLADQRQADLILTSGGTGFSMRDQTPEATMEVADRNAPGIAEYIRMRSAEITDRAMLREPWIHPECSGPRPAHPAGQCFRMRQDMNLMWQCFEFIQNALGGRSTHIFPATFLTLFCDGRGEAFSPL